MSALRVAELWRFPVKSLLGERLDAAQLGAEGVAGDRSWALFDLDTGFGLTARRVPSLLFATGRLRADGAAEVVLPDGTVTRDDAVLSDASTDVA
ncbi:MOSC N-terminal beta barrel domain-containing protein [Modestobacter sp. DSM 44400]|uniref:MOSC N-terminal beta barrel domain-containing protein n=1 Tax=Modestobacter sp. DSM 44400 TaxID=1550230 RepID=UPI00089C4938|nr:MOSC N-terminal beta barrel domain-containing protein [Modestobacter sp. DSM 44400]SDY24083.1 MOSC N-terminal beta barrel domain-containing protein [Modestobacter sp. DSM 44400]